MEKSGFSMPERITVWMHVLCRVPCGCDSFGDSVMEASIGVIPDRALNTVL